MRGHSVPPEGSEQPALTNDWLQLYSNPTVSVTGRPVKKHANAANYDWGMTEELNGNVSASGMLTKNSRDVIQNAGAVPQVNVISNNLYTDDEGRYWVAVAPNVMNPNYNGSSKISDNDMQYGTKLDIVVLDESTTPSTTYYIPAVVGDAKEHSAPDGLYQTGVPFDSSRPTINPGVDRNTVEFMGYDIKDTIINGVSKSSVNITNNYKLEKLIVYDGVYNYK